MFFTPPKVKSLSRYAEYGSYLSNRHFLLMLAVAFTAHMAIIAVYSMLPSEEVVRIPVRALNIKLTGGSIGSIHVNAPPAIPKPAPIVTPSPVIAAAASTPAPSANDEDLESVQENTAESAVDKAVAPKPAVVHPPIHVPKPPAAKTGHAGKGRQKGAHTSAKESTMATPKKYVRDNEDVPLPETKILSSGGGNGSTITGVAGGQEVVTRYTQLISQWIHNHEAIAKAACGEAKQVTGVCDAKGQTVFRIRINREGHIINNTVEHPSGSELVDQAATMMVRASDPVPAVPSDYPSDSQMEFLITVQVDLSKK